MKFLFLVIASLTLAIAAKADDSGNVIVRCEGITDKGTKIGIDTELDQVDRLQSLTVFEGDSASPIDVATLASPSHFLRMDNNQNVLAFGIKTFNDGLEEDLSVLSVAGSPKLSKLKLGNGPRNLAIKQISCRILK